MVFHSNRLIPDRLIAEQCVRVTFAAALFGALGLAAPAQAAYLTDFHQTAPQRMESAIHQPTGCMAQLVYQNNALWDAFIVDPHCLPSGVRMQRIPVQPRDFFVPAGKRQRIRVW